MRPVLGFRPVRVPNEILGFVRSDVNKEWKDRES